MIEINAKSNHSDAAETPVDMPTDSRKQRYNNNKLVKRLRRETGKAIADFNMIEAGDRIIRNSRVFLSIYCPRI